MAKKMLIDATHAEETRVVVVDGNKVEEFDFESQAKRQLAGNIYLAKVTRVEPSLQAAFIDYGGNRHGFLAFSEIHPDYYRIPIADREALIAEERAYAESLKAEAEAEEEKSAPKRRRRSRSRSKAAETKTNDPVVTEEVKTDDVNGTDAPAQIAGMEVVDLDAPAPDAMADPQEGLSHMELVAETPVEEPKAAEETVETPVTEATPEVDEAAPVAESTAPDAAADDAEKSADAADVVEDDAEAEPKKSRDATSKDAGIESVADEDDSEDVRPVRKPRPKRYKIQEVVKTGQILLVQVVKEERGNKGAALTTYLSLAGRYCVLMPNTARGGGISRKITNVSDRKKLKEIANEMDVPDGAGLIIRTAGSQRTKTEIKRDYEYLQRLWEQIRELTLKSVAPAPIYEEGNLIKRSIRDLYSKEIDEVIVEGDTGYRTAKDFMKMIMPSHAKNVKPYNDALPLFARFQVESYLSGMFNPTVQLPSGGYIVIGITEALVAVDVNSGRATKEGSIEQTAVKTNLEAADEVARQLRLRDLAGLIVIDFIDMDERKNNAAVEKRMKDKLKTDRARIQVGRISGFGLMEMSRQRLRPGMLEATTQPCAHCHGTGLLRSDDNTALMILRQLEEEGVRGRSKEVLVRAPIGIANFIMNQKRDHVAQIEARYGLSVRIEADPHMVAPDYAIEKFKTATRVVAEVATPVISSDSSVIETAEEEVEEAVVVDATAEEGQEEKPKKRRRRRRRRRNGGDTENSTENTGENTGENTAENAGEAAPDAQNAEGQTADSTSSDSAETTEAKSDAVEGLTPAEGDAPAKPKRARRSRSRKKAEPESAAEVPAEADATPATEADAPVVEAEDEKPAKPKRTRTRRKTKAQLAAETEAAAAEAASSDAESVAEAAPAAPAAEPTETVAETAEVAAEVAAPAVEPAAVPAAEPVAEPTPEPVAETVAAPVVEAAPVAAQEPAKPKRRGWWSMGGR